MHISNSSKLLNNTLWLMLMALALSGCLLDEEEADDEISSHNVISGSVGDGPIVGASVRVMRNDGELLSEFESDSSASYNVTVKTKGKFYPLTVEAQNGTDLVTDRAPDFVLLGAVLKPNKETTANMNPFSTFAVEIARDLPGGVTKDNLLSGESIAVSELNYGLTSLVSSGPMTAQIDASNIAEMVRASEALGETVRRTRDLLQQVGFESSGDRVLGALASDLTDSVIDGRGGPRTDARTAAVTTIVAAAVQLEAMSNELHVYGADATSAMNAAISQVMESTPAVMIGDLTVTAEMLSSVSIGLAAALAVSDDTKIAELRQAVFGLQAGMDHMLIRTLLPGDYKATLESVIMTVAGGNAAVVNTVNDIARNGDDAPPADAPPEVPPPEDPPPANSSPIISGNPPGEINVNSFYEFKPTASDPDGDVLSFSGNQTIPAWATLNRNTGRLSGTPRDGDVGTYTGITITASDGNASDTLGPFTITVQAISLGSVTLNWIAPTQNEDGTPLDNLAGYQIRWGTTPGNYPNSVTINNPGLTTYVVEDLAPGSYDFVATSFNTAGIHSDHSNPVTKTVP